MQFEIITRTIFGLFAVIFLSKLLGPLLYQFLNEKIWGVKKNHKVDLDNLIERKKQMLRRGEAGVQTDSTPTPVTTRDKRSFQSRSEEFFSQKFQELSKTNDKNQWEKEEQKNIKNILTLFDSLNWGDGPELKSIQSISIKKLAVSLPSPVINKVIRYAIQKNLLLPGSGVSLFDSINEINYFNYTKLELFLALRSIGEILLFSPEHRDSTYHSMGNKFSLNPMEMSHAFQLLVIQKGGLATEASEKTTEKTFLAYYEQKKEKLEKEIYPELRENGDLMLDQLCAYYLTSTPLPAIDAFKKDLLENAHFFQLITPIKINNIKDHEEILKVFSLTSTQVDFSQIKKNYRVLAAQYHPDRFSGKAIPIKLAKCIHDNFTLIKQMYDELEKKYKKR